MAGASDSPAVSFASFTLLPVELRVKIYHLMKSPRLFRVKHAGLRSRPVRNTWKSSTPHPVILHIWRESRLEGLRIYSPAFTSMFTTDVFFDFEIVRLCLSHFDFQPSTHGDICLGQDQGLRLSSSSPVLETSASYSQLPNAEYLVSTTQPYKTSTNANFSTAFRIFIRHRYMAPDSFNQIQHLVFDTCEGAQNSGRFCFLPDPFFWDFLWDFQSVKSVAVVVWEGEDRRQELMLKYQAGLC